MSRIPVSSHRSRRRRARAAAALLALGVAASATPVAAQSTPQDATLAEALFRDGKALMAAGRFAEACPKLEESMRLSPGGGTALNIAACHEGEGKIATAWTEFNDAAAMARRDGRADREKLSRTRIDALEPRLPRLTLSAAPGADLSAAEIKLDGVVVRQALLGTPFPVDPGAHRIVVTAPGRAPWESNVRLAEAERAQVALGPFLPGVATSDGSPGADDPRHLHGGHFGAALRVDVDYKGRGAAEVPMITYGIGDYVEVAAGGILGKNFGGYAGASFFLLKHAWKPMLALGVPLFAVSGPRPGVHGAAGVVWDPHKHFGFMLEAGLMYFPNAPMGYEKALFVPSAAVQGRL